MLNLEGQGVWVIRMLQTAFPPGNVMILKKFLELKFFMYLVLSQTCLPLLSHRQILGTGNLPQDSAPVCILTERQRNQAFCVTAADWSHDHDLININLIVYLMFNLPQFRNSWTDFYRQHMVEKQRFLGFH